MDSTIIIPLISKWTYLHLETHVMQSLGWVTTFSMSGFKKITKQFPQTSDSCHSQTVSDMQANPDICWKKNRPLLHDQADLPVREPLMTCMVTLCRPYLTGVCAAGLTCMNCMNRRVILEELHLHDLDIQSSKGSAFLNLNRLHPSIHCISPYCCSAPFTFSLHSLYVFPAFPVSPLNSVP